VCGFLQVLGDTDFVQDFQQRSFAGRNVQTGSMVGNQSISIVVEKRPQQIYVKQCALVIARWETRTEPIWQRETLGSRCPKKSYIARNEDSWKSTRTALRFGGVKLAKNSCRGASR